MAIPEHRMVRGRRTRRYTGPFKYGTGRLDFTQKRVVRRRRESTDKYMKGDAPYKRVSDRPTDDG